MWAKSPLPSGTPLWASEVQHGRQVLAEGLGPQKSREVMVFPHCLIPGAHGCAPGRSSACERSSIRPQKPKDTNGWSPGTGVDLI